MLDSYVEGGLEAGRWWFFSDVNNQAAVFGAFEEVALSRLMDFGHVLILPTNWRNTKPIADETAMLTRPKVRAVAVLDGIPVRYSWYDKPEIQKSALEGILKRLLSEDVAPSRITVLSPRKADECCGTRLESPRLIQVTEDSVWDIATGACNSVSYCSVSAFKGLENDFIVLSDIEDLESEWWRSVIYVGMSRARIGLHLLLNTSLRSIYETRLRCWLGEHESQAVQ